MNLTYELAEGTEEEFISCTDNKPARRCLPSGLRNRLDRAACASFFHTLSVQRGKYKDNCINENCCYYESPATSRLSVSLINRSNSVVDHLNKEFKVPAYAVLFIRKQIQTPAVFSSLQT